MNVIRGGCYWDHAWDCRSAGRVADGPWGRYGDIGFRTKISTQTYVHGGSWNAIARNCRAAYRVQDDPSLCWEDTGLRTKA